MDIALAVGILVYLAGAYVVWFNTWRELDAQGRDPFWPALFVGLLWFIVVPGIGLMYAVGYALIWLKGRTNQ